MSNENGTAAAGNEQEFDLVVRGERVLTGEGIAAHEVGIRDGKIMAIEPLGHGLVGRKSIELKSDEVMIPGLVDSHVHVNEPGRTEWEGFDSATRAAAAGGVTTIIDMPLNSIPPTVDVEALALKREVAGPRRTSTSVSGAVPFRETVKSCANCTRRVFMASSASSCIRGWTNSPPWNRRRWRPTWPNSPPSIR